MRAPIPLRKFESVEPVAPGARTELRVQIAGVITKEGKLEVRALLRNLAPALESAVLRDVQSWEFKPATQDGTPVDIDVVHRDPVQPAAAGSAKLTQYQSVKKKHAALFGPHARFSNSPGG